MKEKRENNTKKAHITKNMLFCLSGIVCLGVSLGVKNGIASEPFNISPSDLTHYISVTTISIGLTKLLASISLIPKDSPKGWKEENRSFRLTGSIETISSFLILCLNDFVINYYKQ